MTGLETGTRREMLELGLMALVWDEMRSWTKMRSWTMGRVEGGTRGTWARTVKPMSVLRAWTSSKVFQDIGIYDQDSPAYVWEQVET